MWNIKLNYQKKQNLNILLRSILKETQKKLKTRTAKKLFDIMECSEPHGVLMICRRLCIVKKIKKIKKSIR